MKIPKKAKKQHSYTIKFSVDGVATGMAKIDERTVMNRTKSMVALDKGLRSSSEVLLAHDLKSHLKYSAKDKKDLKGDIESFWFKKEGAVADKNDLVNATTVSDLVDRIYNKYIPKGNRK